MDIPTDRRLVCLVVIVFDYVIMLLSSMLVTGLGWPVSVLAIYTPTCGNEIYSLSVAMSCISTISLFWVSLAALIVSDVLRTIDMCPYTKINPLVVCGGIMSLSNVICVGIIGFLLAGVNQDATFCPDLVLASIRGQIYVIAAHAMFLFFAITHMSYMTWDNINGNDDDAMVSWSSEQRRNNNNNSNERISVSDGANVQRTESSSLSGDSDSRINLT